MEEVAVKNIKFVVWDVGGQKKVCVFWVFLIDIDLICRSVIYGIITIKTLTR
jgi:hypothetical protein